MSEHPQLRRNLTLPLVTLYGLGNILGAGVYVLIGKVAGEAGYYAPLSFILASIIAGITAFSYCELSSRYPVSAGEAAYVKNGFNLPSLSLSAGLLIILTGVVSAATIARGFTGYLEVFVELPDSLVIICLIVVLGLICIAGVAQSVTVAALFTVLEIGGLVLILYVAAPALTTLPDSADKFLQPLSMSSTLGLFGGAFLAFYAYIGFEDMVNLAEEVKQPRRVLPIAILLALFIASAIYAMLALSAVLTISPEQLGRSDAPLADIYRVATGSNPWFITIVSLFAVVNGALIQIIMGSRVSYGLAKQGLIPAFFGRIESRTQTPVVATVLVSAVIIVAALWLPIETLARTTTYLLLVLFCIVNLALVRIKRREEAPPHVFAVPIAVPIAGFASCFVFLAVQTWLVLMPLI
ncbi:MAG: APA family basic amino acid/polyamine antiporter [Pseudohongiellaceae bacterium]|jgi:APA family basic amino acid/polyamine antiporter